MQIVEIVNVVSASGCNAASEVNDGGVDKLLCESFSANFEDWEQHASDSTKAYLVEAAKSFTVWHTFTTAAMTSGQRVTIGRTTDGRWITLVWECGQS